MIYHIHTIWGIFMSDTDSQQFMLQQFFFEFKRVYIYIYLKLDWRHYYFIYNSPIQCFWKAQYAKLHRVQLMIKRENHLTMFIAETGFWALIYYNINIVFTNQNSVIFAWSAYKYTNTIQWCINQNSLALMDNLFHYETKLQRIIEIVS